MLRIDPKTLEVEAVVDIDVIDTSSVAAGEGAVWITSGSDLMVVDPESSRVADTVPFRDGAGAVAVGQDRIWVVAGPPESAALRSAVVALNPTTHTVAATSPPQALGLTGITVGSRGVWASDPAHGTVVQFDPVTAKKTAAVKVDSWQYVRGIAAGFGFVWIVDRANGIITAVAEASREAHSLEAEAAVAAVAAGSRSVWVTDDVEGFVLAFPISGEKPDLVALKPGVGPVAAGEMAGWVTNHMDSSLSRIDEDSLKVRTIGLEVRPVDVAVGEGAVWVLYDELSQSTVAV